MRVLFITLSGLGDTLMHVPMMEILKAKMPDAETHALTKFIGSKEVLEGNPALDKVMHFDFEREGVFGTLKFVSKLRNYYDVTITCYPANRIHYNLFQFLMGGKIRLAHSYRHWNILNCWFLNHTIMEDDNLHNVDENIRLLKFLGINYDNSDKKYVPKIYLSEENKQFARKYVEKLRNGKLLIGMHTWSTEFKNMHKKCWGQEKFAKLIDLLYEELNAITLIFEGPNDKKAVEFIMEKTRHKPHVVRDLKIKDMAAIIQQCDLFITNDSGIMHVAEAVGAPLCVIFGPTNPAWSGPYAGKFKIIRKNLRCMPCFRYSPEPLKCKVYGDFRCLKDLEVDYVFEEVKNFLDEMKK